MSRTSLGTTFLMLSAALSATLLAAAPVAANVFDKDDRREVASQDYPWCCIGMVTHDNSMGTGFLIGRNLVLTNCHCTLDEEGKPAEQISFAAGFVGRPLKTSRVNRVWRGTDNLAKNYKRDWAVLRLDDNLGDELGWLPLSSTLPKTAELVGYSGDWFRSHHMAARSKCRVLREVDGVVLHDADATRGSSGGPLLAMCEGRPHVVALNFGEMRDGEVSMVVDDYDDEHTNLAVPVHSFHKQVKKILGDKSHGKFCDTLQQAKDAMAAGEDDAALAALDAAGELQPENALVHTLRGSLRLKQEEYDEAAAEFETAIRLDPQSPDATLLLARTYFEQQEEEKCIETLDDLLARTPRLLAARHLRARAELRLVERELMADGGGE